MPITVLADNTIAAAAQAVAELLEGSSNPVMPVSAVEEAALRRSLEDEPPQPVPPGTALVMRTSGSTSGVGKSVLVSLNSLTASAHATHEALGGPWRWACCLPTHHIAGFQTIFRSLLSENAPLDAGKGSPEEIARIAAGIADDRVYLSLVPTQLVRLLDSPHAAAARAFATILLGGSAASPEMVSRAREAGLNIVTTYGMTETCGGCVYNGLPIGDTSISLGEGGRITIAGSVVATGYLGAAPFDGKCVTQDAGSWADGRLRIHGRLDGAITTGGLTILPQVVEAELEKMGSGQCVVVGIPDAQWGEIVVAVTTNPLDDPRGRLRQRLEAGYTPRVFFTAAQLGLESLPYLASGKIDRRGVQRLVGKRL